MADLSWNDLLSNTSQYPDSMVWTMEDGSTIALGTLRQTLRGSFVPQSEYEAVQRRAQEQQQSLANEKRLLEQQLIERLSQPTPPTTAAQPPEVYLTDPLFKPMWDELTSTKQLLVEMRKLQEQSQAREQQMFQTVQQIPVVMHVQKIQAKDPSVDGQKLLEFAREHHIQPQHLEDAYTLMTHEQALARAKDEGMQAGLDKAKADLAAQAPQVPYAPFGPPQMVPQNAPKFENDTALEQAMLGDPEIMQVYLGQA